MPDLSVVDEGEKMAANYVHITGPVSCIRCDYSTAIEHEMGAPLEIQQELLMGHLNAIHPDWQLDGFKRAAEREQLKAQHQRLQSAVVEAAKADRIAATSGKGGNGDLDAMIAIRGHLRIAVDALIAFEAENKIGVE
jgi:hypothetical protein